MKKLLYFVGIALMLASCTDDYKDWAEPQSNPQEDAQNVTISVAPASAIDLRTIEDLEATDVQLFVPTIAAAEGAEVTFKGTLFNEDKSKSVGIETDAQGNINANDLQNAVTSIYGNKAEARTMTLEIVANVLIDGQSIQKKLDPITVTVTPVPLAAPTLWYLVGGCIGDGSWNNSEAGIGTGLVPMLCGDTEDFSIVEYAGYFPAGGEFKIIETPGDWDHGICGGDENGGQTYRDGGDDPGNIKINEAGYYHIKVNVGTKECTIEPFAGTINVCSGIFMPGNYQGWNAGANPMTPMEAVVECHSWMADVTFADAALFKFAANGDWGLNWGGTTFPIGIGVNNGDNINVPVGNYTIFFNDLLGYYYFITK